MKSTNLMHPTGWSLVVAEEERIMQEVAEIINKEKAKSLIDSSKRIPKHREVAKRYNEAKETHEEIKGQTLEVASVVAEVASSSSMMTRLIKSPAKRRDSTC